MRKIALDLFYGIHNNNGMNYYKFYLIKYESRNMEA